MISAGGGLGGGGQGLLGGAFACLFFPVDHVIPGDLVLTGAHQGQLHLVLHILDVDGAAGGHATLEGGGDQLGQLGHGFMDAAGGRGGAAFHSEKGLGNGHCDLAGLKRHHGAIALDDAQLPRCGGGDAAADVADSCGGVVASAAVPPWLVSVCMLSPKCWRLALFFWVTTWKVLLTRNTAQQVTKAPWRLSGGNPCLAAIASIFCSFFSRYTQYIGVYASLRYKIMRLQEQCKGIRLGLFCG